MQPFARLPATVLAFVGAAGLLWCGCGSNTRPEPSSDSPPVAPALDATGPFDHDVPLTDGTSDGDSSAATAAPTQADVTYEPGRVGSIELGLAEESQADLSIHDWTTEAAHDVISRQLDEFAKRITHHDALAHSWLATLVTNDFHCTPLRPAPLEVVFDDSAVVVSRPRAASSPAAIEFHRAEGLAAAVRLLMNETGDETTAEVKFKVFRIEIEGSQITTSLYYSLRAPMSDKSLQQTATWQCVWKSHGVTDSPRLQAIEVLDYEEAVGRGLHGGWFADCTESVLAANSSYQRQLVYGLDYWMGRIESRFGIEISGWNGLALGDVNGDGLDDIYLCQPGGLPNRLFLQNPDGTATDHSAKAGVDWRDESSSALFVDLDNDGDQDLVLATALGLIVMSNDGRAAFRVETVKSLPEAAPLSLAAADFDNDGYVDIYVTCYSIRGNSKERRFLGRPVPYHDANNGGRNALFRNHGTSTLRFTNVTQAVGLDQNNRRFSMAAAWEDYDNDGDMDLYVANDYGRNNLFRNDAGRFRDIAAEAGVEDISAGMSVSWGDVNGDGLMDLYVSNMFSSAGNRIAYQRRFQATAEEHVRAAFQRHARGNSLFLNSGDGTFSDVSVTAQVTMGRWAWGSRFVDINNDSWPDIVVANGFITQADPADL